MWDQKKVTWIFNLNYKLNLKKCDWSQKYSSLIMKKWGKDGVLLLTEFMFCLLACQLSSLPSSVSPTTLIAVFPVRHLPPCFSSSLLETQCLASKSALERIHQLDQYSLENASSALLPSVLLCIVFIQLRMPFGGDRRTCFPNILQSPIRLAFCRCRTPNTKPPMHTQSYLSWRSWWVGVVCLQ